MERVNVEPSPNTNMTTIAHIGLAQSIRQIDAILEDSYSILLEREFRDLWNTAVTRMSLMAEYSHMSRADLSTCLRACFPALSTRYHA